jgi:hypothetical protein
VADLPFLIDHQMQDQWCWAAVAIGVCRFYNDQKWRQQCDLVNAIFAPIRGDTDCCEDGDTSNCNMPWALDVVLNTAGHLVQPVRGPLTFEELKQQILVQKRPLAVRIMLADLMTTHFVVVIGCDEAGDGGQWVKVADPGGSTGNTNTIEYAALLNDYKPGANWDQSYLTC